MTARDAIARLAVPRGTGSRVDPRSPGEATVAAAAHPRLTYRPELDAIRGVAVLLVLLQHFGLMGIGREHGRAGQVGVTLFFVLSGYLITSLLLAERQTTGSVSLRSFYGRRLRRLFPALVFMVAVVSFVGIPGTPLTALTYTTNLLIATGGDPGAYVHTWTLAIEEQFYLVWPIAFLALVSRPRLLIAVLAVVAAISAAAFYPPAVIERGAPLAMGATLALVGIRLPAWAGLLGWAGVIALSAIAGPLDAPMMLAATVASAAVVAGSTIRARPLVWLGTISYGVYLWSYPIAVLVPTSTIVPAATAFGIGLTILMAVWSERFVERRWRLRRDVVVVDVGSPVQGAGIERLGDGRTERDLRGRHGDPERDRQEQPLASS